MDRSFNLLKHLPERWRSLKEVIAICDSDVKPVGDRVEHTLPHLWDCMDAELNNSFILPYEDKDGADEYACYRWESILGIIAPDDMTLRDRQFNIYTKLYQSTPYTYNRLEDMLSEFVEPTNYTMTRDVSSKTIEVKISLKSRFMAESVAELLDRIVPADMILNVIIIYTTYNDISQYTHNELSVYTNDEIKVTQM